MTAPTLELDFRRYARAGAVLGVVGRIACLVGLLAAGFAGLAFLSDAESTGAGRLQVNESVRQLMLEVAAQMVRVGVCIGLIVEVTLYVLVRMAIPWRNLIWTVPAAWSLAGAGLAWRVLRLDELDVVPKVVMLTAGGCVVLFLSVSMHATLWQASFDVAPEVTDFPYVWYLALVMLMSAFFGGFRGWTDLSPMARRVLDYRRQNWPAERSTEFGRPTPEAWIQ